MSYLEAPVSEGRKNLIRTILSEREVNDQAVRDELFRQAAAGMTNGQAASWIVRLKQFAKKGQEVSSVKVTEIGFYRHGEDVYKVKFNQAGTRLNSYRVTPRGFDYDGGAIFKLDASTKMTAKEIQAYSLHTQVCANCSTPLSDPISEHIGLGTKCGPDILGPETYKAQRKAAKLVPAVAAKIAAIKAEKEAKKIAA